MRCKPLFGSTVKDKLTVKIQRRAEKVACDGRSVESQRARAGAEPTEDPKGLKWRAPDLAVWLASISLHYLSDRIGLPGPVIKISKIEGSG